MFHGVDNIAAGLPVSNNPGSETGFEGGERRLVS